MRSVDPGAAVEAGAVLFREGEPGDCAYYLERGEVEVAVTRGDRRVVLARKGPGELFGEMAIVDGRRRSATVAALTPCELILVTRAQLHNRLRRADPVLRLCLTLLMDRLRSTVEHVQAVVEPGCPSVPRSGSSTPAPCADRALAAAAIRIEHDLERALAEGEFELHHQPIVSLRTGRAVGFEALIRWRHPERGLLPPAAFLPAAEACGLIARIDVWAVAEACSAWRRLAAAGLPRCSEGFFVGVNVSAPGLARPGFLDHLRGRLQVAGLPPGALKLEITETILMTGEAGPVLGDCRALGVPVSLDDFGTGCSSLSYLHRFPIDTLKLDRSFVQDCDGEAGAPPILRAVLRLADGLGLPVVAEGIERADQRRLLAGLGAGFGQGYHFSRPLPADAAAALLARRGRLRRAPLRQVRAPAPRSTAAGLGGTRGKRSR